MFTLKRRRGVLKLLAVVFAFTLIAAACGDDDTDASDTGTTADTGTDDTGTDDTGTDDTGTDDTGTDDTGADDTGTDDTGAEPMDPVLIVGLMDLTGPSPTSVGADKVAQATVDAINAADGLNGHQIELEIIDTTGDAASAQATIAEMAGKNPIAWLISTSVETAISEAMSATNLPVIGVGYNPAVWGGSIPTFGLNCEGNPDYCASPNFYTITTTFSAVVDEQVLGAQAAGATVLATAACAEVDSCSAAAPVFEAAVAGVGLESAGVTKVSSTAADYTSECIGFIEAGANFIQISGSSAMGVRLMEDCADQGYDGIWGASAGTVSGDLILQPYVLAGGLNAFPWFVDDAPVVEYRDIMAAAGVTEAEWSGPTQTALYSALRLFEKAITDHADPAAPLDAAAALAAMNSVTDETLGGLIAPVTFTADNLDRARSCFWPYIKDAENNFTNPLGGLNYQCYPE